MATANSISEEKELSPVMVQYRWYRKHQDELVKRYYGRFLVIGEQKVWGNYSSRGEAMQEGLKLHKPGTFMIRHCVPIEEERVIIWNDRHLLAC